MARWTVYAHGTITLLTVVEAKSAEKAKEIALERDVTGLAYGAELDNETEAWTTSGELDCCVQPDDVTSIEKLK